MLEGSLNPCLNKRIILVISHRTRNSISKIESSQQPLNVLLSHLLHAADLNLSALMIHQ